MGFDVIMIQKLILASENRRIRDIEDNMGALHYLAILNSGGKGASGSAKQYFRKASKKHNLVDEKKKSNFTQFLKLHTNNDIFSNN
jgi:hypothetical protein